MREVWLEISSTITYAAKRTLAVLPILLIIFNPFLTLIVVARTYETYGQWRWEMFIVPIGLLLMTYIANVVRRVVIMQQYGMPVARKRFTRRDENNRIIFEMSELPEMVEYLVTIEEYCEKHGMYHKTQVKENGNGKKK